MLLHFPKLSREPVYTHLTFESCVHTCQARCLSGEAKKCKRNDFDILTRCHLDWEGSEHREDSPEYHAVQSFELEMCYRMPKLN